MLLDSFGSYVGNKNPTGTPNGLNLDKKLFHRIQISHAVIGVKSFVFSYFGHVHLYKYSRFCVFSSITVCRNNIHWWFILHFYFNIYKHMSNLVPITLYNDLCSADANFKPVFKTGVRLMYLPRKLGHFSSFLCSS